MILTGTAQAQLARMPWWERDRALAALASVDRYGTTLDPAVQPLVVAGTICAVTVTMVPPNRTGA